MTLRGGSIRRDLSKEDLELPWAMPEMPAAPQPLLLSQLQLLSTDVLFGPGYAA